MRVVVFAALAVFLLVGGLTSVSGQKKPPDKKEVDTQKLEWGGKTLEQWIKEISSKDPSRGEIAIHAVLEFGPDRAYEAVPVLLKELDKHKPPRDRLDTCIRVNATIALGVILGRIKDSDPKWNKAAVRILTRLLNDGQSIVRFRAAQALGQMGLDAKPAVPGLLAALRDPDAWETRQAAASALGLIVMDKDVNPPVDVTTALAKRLEEGLLRMGKEPAFQVRLAAIQSLTWMGGPANAKHRNGLIKYLEPVALKDTEPTVRIWGHMAIMSISQEIDEEHIAPISAMLKHKDLAVRIQAAQALGTIQPAHKAKSSVRHLCAALKDRDLTVTFWSMWALSRMGKSAVAALPSLQLVMNDPKMPDPMKKAAEETIDTITGKEKKKTPPKK